MIVVEVALVMAFVAFLFWLVVPKGTIPTTIKVKRISPDMSYDGLIEDLPAGRWKWSLSGHWTKGKESYDFTYSGITKTKDEGISEVTLHIQLETDRMKQSEQ